jgi:hypothetical protein
LLMGNEPALTAGQARRDTEGALSPRPASKRLRR